MSKLCSKILLGVKVSDFDNMLKLLRLIGIENIFSELRADNTYIFEFYVRNTDLDYIKSRINELSEQYRSETDLELSYSIHDTSVFDDIKHLDPLTNIISYKDISIIFEPAKNMINDPIYTDYFNTMDYVKRHYVENSLEKKDIYTLPFKNNEYLFSFITQLNSIKSILVGINSLNFPSNKVLNLLCIGENKFFYSDIIQNHYLSEIDIMIDDLLYIDLSSKECNYDCIIVNLDRFIDPRLRDLAIWSQSYNKSVIVSGIRLCDEYFYHKLFEDIKYEVIYTDKNCVFLIGSDFDNEAYINDYGSGI